MKTSVGAPDPQAYVYVASTLRRAGRTAHQIQGTMENLLSSVRVVTATVHGILEQYYFDREAEARWEDDGGPCD
jgi:hypothetical protein